MSMTQVGIAALMLFLGSTALSATGFGIGMVAMPGLLFVLEPQTAVVVLNTIAIAIEAWIVVQSRKDIPFREVLPIAVAGAVGVPLAVYILKFADPSIMRIGISVLVLMFAAIATVNFQRDFPYSRVVGVLAGFVVGVVLPAFGVGGPLVTLYLLTRNWQRRSVRAGMAFYLLVLDVFAVAGLCCRRSLHCREADADRTYGDTYAGGVGTWRNASQCNERARIPLCSRDDNNLIQHVGAG